MKVKIRRTSYDDLDKIYDLHTKCFFTTDQWYKSNIKHYLDKGIVVEKSDNSQIIAVLLQGNITPCNKKIDTEQFDYNNLYYIEDNQNKIDNSGDYKEDIFEPVSDTGYYYLKNNLHFNDIYGIVMICVHPDFRGKGLAKKLIEKHFKDNPNKILCLNTRKSNIGAFMLYKSMGYEHIANIKNKYFLPNEDSIFMTKEK